MKSSDLFTPDSKQSLAWANKMAYTIRESKSETDDDPYAPPSKPQAPSIGFGRTPSVFNLSLHTQGKSPKLVSSELWSVCDHMEGYEQHNEVSTSYNNNNMKTNFNDKDFYLMEDKREYGFLDKTYQKESQQQTPFSVKDILNINQPNYTYDRNEMWKLEKDRRNYEFYEVYSQQNQAHCADYFNQSYSNPPPLAEMHTEYWNTEYHDHKVENYYNFNPYCHSLYHQNFEHYVDIEVPPYHSVVDPVKTETAVTAAAISVQERVPNNSGYNLTEPTEKISPVMPRKITSKFINKICEQILINLYKDVFFWVLGVSYAINIQIVQVYTLVGLVFYLFYLK